MEEKILKSSNNQENQPYKQDTAQEESKSNKQVIINALKSQAPKMEVEKAKVKDEKKKKRKKNRKYRKLT